MSLWAPNSPEEGLGTLVVLVVSMSMALWIFYGDPLPLPFQGEKPEEEQVMNFYLIKDIDEDVVNGVVIESEEGLVHARLAGDKGTDDPKRILPSLLGRMPSRGFPVEKKERSSRTVGFMRPGQPGFVVAWLSRVRPPLKLDKSGVVPPDKIGKPENMTRDLWETFASGLKMPKHEPIPLP